MRHTSWKRQAFVNEYLKDLNGARAAIRAGYSAHSAREIASELLLIPEVATEIERAMEQRRIRTQMEHDEVINEVALLAFSRVTNYAVDEDTGDLMLRDTAPLGAVAAVRSVKHQKRVHEAKDGAVVTTLETHIELWDKPRMLFLLGRHLGLFSDRIEVTGPNGGPVETVTRIERRILPQLPPSSLLDAPHRSGVIPAQDDSRNER